MRMNEEVIVLGVIAFLVAFCGGCVNAETGSRTVIGNHYALPKLSTTGGEVELNLYESTEGAAVTTRKDSLVEIVYSNSYTNTILGLWDKKGEMALTVKVTPLKGETNSLVVVSKPEKTTPPIFGAPAGAD